MREKISNVYEEKVQEIADEKAEEKAHKTVLNTMKYFGYIVSFIFEDMIECMKNHNQYRKDYHAVFSKIDKDIIDIAYQSSESMLCNYGTNIIIGNNEMKKFSDREEDDDGMEHHDFENNSEDEDYEKDYDY
jgi:hypothetical protein